MIFINQNTTNNIVVSNQHLDTSGFTFTIVNEMSHRVVEILGTPTEENDRYLRFEFIHTDDPRNEDIALDIVYIENGFSTIIGKTLDGKEFYNDLLFVEYNELDTYQNNQDNEVFVYERK